MARLARIARRRQMAARVIGRYYFPHEGHFNSRRDLGLSYSTIKKLNDQALLAIAILHKNIIRSGVRLCMVLVGTGLHRGFAS
jgi:hypothetical protein